MFPQSFQNPYRYGGVFLLMLAQQGQPQMISPVPALHRQILPLHIRRPALPGYIRSDPDRRRALLPASRQDRIHCRRVLRRDYYRHARFDDARLVRRNLPKRIPQDRHVIQADRSYGADGGIYNISGVQPAAQAHLDGLKIHFILGKALKGHGRHKLKEGNWPQIGIRRQLPGGRLQLADQLGKAGRADRLGIPPQAFPKGMQVRRGIKAGAVAGGVQGGVDHRRRAAFPLGAGNVDSGNSPMGIA